MIKYMRIQAFEWVNSDYQIKWINPLIGNEKALGLDIGFEINRRLSLEKAKTNDAPTMSNPIELVQGGSGFIVYFPIYVDNKFDGFLTAVFKVEPWLNHVFQTNSDHESFSEFKISVQIDDTTVYTQKGWDALKSSPFDATVLVTIMDHQLVIKCRPTPAFF